jgi:DNA-binding transcriptional ArsR family regulator
MLKKAGITKSRKEGRKVFYSIDYESFKEIWAEFEQIVLK